MPDLSRRTILTGLLAAPVAVPAAVAFGASNSLGFKSAPLARGGLVSLPLNWKRLGDEAFVARRTSYASAFTRVGTVGADGLLPMKTMDAIEAVVNPPREGDTLRTMRPGHPDELQRFTSDQWLKVEDTTAHGPEDDRLSGTSPTLAVLDEPDVLDWDLASFTALSV